MRGMLLCAALLMVASTMMGCTDSIIPCTTDEDCVMDWGWDGNDAAHGGGDMGLVCNLEVSPLERCNEMMAYLPPLDWLPFGDWIVLPDCEELFGGLPKGVCESSWGWF